MIENNNHTIWILLGVASMIVVVLVKIVNSVARASDVEKQHAAATADLEHFRAAANHQIEEFHQIDVDDDTDIARLKRNLDMAKSGPDKSKLILRQLKQTMHTTRFNYTQSTRKRGPAVRGRGAIEGAVRFFQAQSRYNSRAQLADDLAGPEQLAAVVQNYINEADAFILRVQNRVREIKHSS